VERFCYNSAAIEAKEIRVGRDDIDMNYQYEMRLPVRTLYENLTMFSCEKITAPMVKTIDVSRLECYIESNLERFQTRVHIKYGNNHHVCYGISDHAMMDTPVRNLVEMIAPQMAEMLQLEVKKRFRK
jgi:exoribonuclease II